MKAKLIREMSVSKDTPEEWITDKGGKPVCAEGLVFEHPQAYYQVLLGNAEPADAECQAIVDRKMSPEKLKEVRKAYDELLTTGSFTGVLDEDDEPEDEFDEGDE